MLTITVIDGAAQLVEHTDPDVIIAVVRSWVLSEVKHSKHMSESTALWAGNVVGAFSRAVADRDYESAAIHAQRLGISLGVAAAPATQPTYIVPVDPADETNCEACQ